MLKIASFKHRLTLWRSITLGVLSLGLLPLLAPRPAQGAEGITLTYGVLQQSLSVNALESYTATGVVKDDLAMYTHYATPEQLAQLQEILLVRIPLDSQKTSRLLDTPIGIQLVQRLAALIQSDDPSRSSAAVRAALIRAADEPGGLTVLNVLRQFPDDQIEINLSNSLDIVAELKSLVNQTHQMIAQVNQQDGLKGANLPSPRLSELNQINLQQQGHFTWEQRTLILTDPSRNRTFPVDLYLPIDRRPHPVIVISHGLSSDRASFAYLAQHLVTYGFVVAIPEHPGSNWAQLHAVFDGKANQITPPHEFIDRPLDVSFLLDELGQLAQSSPNFHGWLDLERVGVVGQSFGGYTALVLAGATINFQELETDCPTSQVLLNPSLLLQCRALSLPRRNYDLADPRVKAVIAISPIASSVLGQANLSQIRLPVLMTASSNDILAPALIEQFYPFTWLTTSDKYLALFNGATHFSSIAPPTFGLHQGTNSTDTKDIITRRYIAALSTAFLQTYVADRPSYRSYLNSTYANAISEKSLQLSLVQSLAVPQLHRASSHFFPDSPLIFIGIGAQAIGVVYWIRARSRPKIRADDQVSITK